MDIRRLDWGDSRSVYEYGRDCVRRNDLVAARYIARWLIQHGSDWSVEGEYRGERVTLEAPYCGGPDKSGGTSHEEEGASVAGVTWRLMSPFNIPVTLSAGSALRLGADWCRSTFLPFTSYTVLGDVCSYLEAIAAGEHPRPIEGDWLRGADYNMRCPAWRGVVTCMLYALENKGAPMEENNLRYTFFGISRFYRHHVLLKYGLTPFGQKVLEYTRQRLADHVLGGAHGAVDMPGSPGPISVSRSDYQIP